MTLRLGHRVKLLVCILGILLNWLWEPAKAQDLTGDARAQALSPNVVKIIATPIAGATARIGFGFIVGLQNGQAVIVTANHVVRDLMPDAEDKAPRITFFESQGVETIGALQATSLSQARGDLAVILAPKPPILSFVPAAQSATPAIRGLEVWPVGRGGTWNVPVLPGRVSRVDAIDGRIYVENLSVGPGSSGGPLISRDGIVGMLTTDGGPTTEVRTTTALPITAIRQVVRDEWRYNWQLVSPAPTPPAPPTSLPPSVVISGRADTMCPDLKSLVELSGQEFRTIRKEPLKNDAWETTAVLFGFKHCEVQKLDNVTLVCDAAPLATVTSAREKMNQLARAAGDCLGTSWRRTTIQDDLIGFNAPSGAAVLYGAVKSLQIPGAPTTYTPSLQIYTRTNTVTQLPPDAIAKKPVGYCDHLKEVIKSTDDKFNAIMGRKPRNSVNFVSKVQLEGWQDCSIAESDDKTRWFTCELSPFDAPSSADALSDELSTDLKACLGPNWTPKRRRTSNGQLDIEFVSADIAATVEIRSTKSYNNTWELKLDVNLD